MLVILAAVAALAVLPDPARTPGATNPAVTQATIQQTICVSGWTKTIRPKAAYTNKLKRQQLAALGLQIDPRTAEEDHLISLEIGGNPTDPLNLWPEPWAGPWGAHRKDAYETFLKRAVCRGEITLERAQSEIRTDWIAGYLHHPEQLPGVGAPHP
ncbi:MAG: hypothetical protein JWQ97_4066 [Phenylobacterium sp.]|nr:hypothetical protein [Phenylobacterium sp.]